MRISAPTSSLDPPLDLPRRPPPPQNGFALFVILSMFTILTYSPAPLTLSCPPVQPQPETILVLESLSKFTYKRA